METWISCWRFGIVAWVVLGATGFVHAHKVDVRLEVKIGVIEAVVASDDGTPIPKAKIVVSSDGFPVTEGTTDAKGKWSFLIPEPGEYRLRADAGAGHLAFAEFKVDPNKKVEIRASTSTAPFHFPWVQATIGLTVIAALAGAMIVAARLSRQPANAPTPDTNERKGNSG
ncbi:MAG: carboxypeptidase-like regulatory domain-containing protein [Gemmataceae bacterium]